MIETSPDVLPIISQVDGLEGFHVATGFSGHGFGIGPGAGRLVADLVTGAAGAGDVVGVPVEAILRWIADQTRSGDLSESRSK